MPLANALVGAYRSVGLAREFVEIHVVARPNGCAELTAAESFCASKTSSAPETAGAQLRDRIV
jgi:hypothetical protein